MKKVFFIILSLVVSSPAFSSCFFECFKKKKNPNTLRTSNKLTPGSIYHGEQETIYPLDPAQLAQHVNENNKSNHGPIHRSDPNGLTPDVNANKKAVSFKEEDKPESLIDASELAQALEDINLPCKDSPVSSGSTTPTLMEIITHASSTSSSEDEKTPLPSAPTYASVQLKATPEETKTIQPSTVGIIAALQNSDQTK